MPLNRSTDSGPSAAVRNLDGENTKQGCQLTKLILSIVLLLRCPVEWRGARRRTRLLRDKVPTSVLVLDIRVGTGMEPSVRGKRLLASWCMAICLRYSAPPHVTARLPVDRFSRNLTSDYFSIICRENPILIKIWQDEEHFHENLGMFVICGWKFFWMRNVLQKINYTENEIIHSVFGDISFWNIALFSLRLCGKNGRTYRPQVTI
jgi:hypothetical protein